MFLSPWWVWICSPHLGVSETRRVEPLDLERRAAAHGSHALLRLQNRGPCGEQRLAVRRVLSCLWSKKSHTCTHFNLQLYTQIKNLINCIYKALKISLQSTCVWLPLSQHTGWPTLPFGNHDLWGATSLTNSTMQLSACFSSIMQIISKPLP